LLFHLSDLRGTPCIECVAVKINSNTIDFEIVRDRPVVRGRLFGRPWCI